MAIIYANLSRKDAGLLSIYQNGASYIHPVGNSTVPIIFTSVGSSSKCQLYEPKQGAKSLKVIEVALLSGEFERLVGAVGMITNEEQFHAQFSGDDLSFCTSFAPSGCEFSFFAQSSLIICFC